MLVSGMSIVEGFLTIFLIPPTRFWIFLCWLTTSASTSLQGFRRIVRYFLGFSYWGFVNGYFIYSIFFFFLLQCPSISLWVPFSILLLTLSLFLISFLSFLLSLFLSFLFLYFFSLIICPFLYSAFFSSSSLNASIL
jgi:hypothetical protein